ncbi:MAG TPA: hypothetical protein VFV38_34860 [Ktedonobacteraceae bacterium]|nr:hypothetical protein [Ktedonobacteraceae bacterium]
MNTAFLHVDPRTVKEEDFPTTGTPAEQWLFLLNYALLAPSEYNTQPWLFRVHGESVDLYADETRRLPIVDPEDRELLISCGAACFNLRLAARHFGYHTQMEVQIEQERRGWLIRLHLGAKQPATEEERLFAAIPHRHSNRSLYEARGVPKEVIARLQACAGYEGTWLQLIEDASTRRLLSDLIVTGDRRQWANQPFRQELAQWVRAQRGGSTDGLPGEVRAKGSIQEITGPFVVRTFDLWREEAAKDLQLVAGAPVLAVLGTFSDCPDGWFMAGMAVERLLLSACTNGLQTSFVNQPIEVPALRSRLRQALGRDDFPQLVIRMGYGKPAPMTPRRNVQEVLLTSPPE